ncbi:MAG: metallophosphoesterase [Clostridium sp.]|nr:metallophosphoesterase [Clostridium sp.]MCM1444616.1 metallophosphoesterase [Candidatus Amulumruptor caecigallinarius]
MEEKKHRKLFKFLKILIFIIIIISIIILYSRYIATTNLNIKEYKVTSNLLPDNFNGIKIAHISDIHYKSTVDRKFLEEIVNEINKTKPDIVVFTGDLIDKNTVITDEIKNELIENLSNIESRLGKYAIKGEDDYNIDEFEDIITKSNFIYLNDNYDLIYNKGFEPIVIVGLNSSKKSDVSITDRLNNIDDYEEYNYKLLLLHEPDYIDNIDYSSFSLILAGSSHGGQIRFPFIGGIIKLNGSKKYTEEKYTFENTNMYISFGLGTKNIKYRFMNRPSFNLYRLTK